MTDAIVAREAFSIGSCLKRALSVFFANFISFNLLGLVIMVPGAVLLFALVGAAFASLFLGTQALGDAPPDLGGFHFGAFGLAWTLILTLQYLLTAVIVFGALRYLQGNKASFPVCLMQGLRRLGPIIVIAIASTILMMLGFVLLIVPGIIVALMICLAIPVLMVENPGILASLSRSSELTKGYRWHLLGLFLVAIVATTVVNIIVPLPFQLLVFVNENFAIAGGIVGGAMQLFTTVFFAVLLGVAYHDLRVAKEGVSTAQIAAVFD